MLLHFKWGKQTVLRVRHKTKPCQIFSIVAALNAIVPKTRCELISAATWAVGTLLRSASFLRAAIAAPFEEQMTFQSPPPPRAVQYKGRGIRERFKGQVQELAGDKCLASTCGGRDPPVVNLSLTVATW